MKIDYDRPVMGRLKKGWYWAIGVKKCTPVFVYEGQVRYEWPYVKPTTVKQWRDSGWQFYPARLPRPRKGAK